MLCGGVTRSFPVAMARERGECPLHRRSVLALCESRRATILLAFCKTGTHKWTKLRSETLMFLGGFICDGVFRWECGHAQCILTW